LIGQNAWRLEANDSFIKRKKVHYLFHNTFGYLGAIPAISKLSKNLLTFKQQNYKYASMDKINMIKISDFMVLIDVKLCIDWLLAFRFTASHFVSKNTARKL